MKKRNRIAITPGEPAGIGPDLVVQIAQQPYPVELIAIADKQLLLQRAQQLQLPLKIIDFNAQQLRQHTPGTLIVQHVPLQKPCHCGQLEPENAQYVLSTLTIAGQACLAGQYDALVTAPVHKAIINQAGIPFTGHTEFLAQLTNTQQVVMMLVAEQLRVALATTHLPLSEVAQAINPTDLEQTITILHKDLQQRFAIQQPQILVCGLNPHAGEAGYLGHEEIEIITPVIKQLNHSGMNLLGPLPADTLFTRQYLQQADAVLAMYHDQGLPVLKYAGFGKAVNVTLGLPIIRTSVDHGTALALAGSGKANPGSLHAAIQLAIQLTDE